MGLMNSTIDKYFQVNADIDQTMFRTWALSVELQAMRGVPGVSSAVLTVPPASPAFGDAYVVAPGATLAWLGKDNNVAVWREGTGGVGFWYFIAPFNGYFVFNAATGNLLKFSSSLSVWQVFSVAGGGGATTFAALTDVSVGGAPEGSILVKSGSQWVAATRLENQIKALNAIGSSQSIASNLRTAITSYTEIAATTLTAGTFVDGVYTATINDVGWHMVVGTAAFDPIAGSLPFQSEVVVWHERASVSIDYVPARELASENNVEEISATGLFYLNSGDRIYMTIRQQSGATRQTSRHSLRIAKLSYVSLNATIGVTSITAGNGLAVDGEAGESLTDTGVLHLADMPPLTVKGNPTIAADEPTDITAEVLTSMLDVAKGDTGGGGVKGLVPAAAIGDAAEGRFLAADMTYRVPGMPAGLKAIAVTANASDLVEGILPFARLPGFDGDVNSADSTKTLTIKSEAVTNGKLAKMAPGTVKANPAETLGPPQDVTIGDFLAILEPFLPALSGAGVTLSTASVPPALPSIGDEWWSETDHSFFKFLPIGGTGRWVQIN